jgi:hypothetical protein
LNITPASVRVHYCEDIRRATGKHNLTAAVISILRDPEALRYVMED